MTRYIIAGGVAGKQRLEAIARALWPTTAALLTDAGVGRGMRVLDLGCGGGDVAFKLAAIVGPTGSVVGLDMDETKLALARQAAAASHCGNVMFRTAQAQEWCDEDCYDCIYCRFLLTHLSDPLTTLKQMRRALRPGGVVVLEDIDFSGNFSYPANGGFDTYVRLYRAAAARQGADADIGPKLHGMLAAAGWRDVAVRVVQPVFVSGEGKQLALLTLVNIADGLVQEGLATEAELHAAVDDLRAFTNDPGSLISFPRLFQLWARRE